MRVSAAFSVDNPVQSASSHITFSLSRAYCKKRQKKQNQLKTDQQINLGDAFTDEIFAHLISSS